MDVNQIAPQPLCELRDMFVRAGFDLRLVGGCVRDMLGGNVPHDIDLCTDAFPDEQIELYKSNGVKFIETGLQHGTVTVVLDNESYEITSLRTEDEHDGRYAKMTYTRDWVEDLSRRDLTVNAMSLDFDGVLTDPFGGQADLERGIIRFVGDAEERMTEDYLRILRYFRFLGRLGPAVVDEVALKETMPVEAIRNCVHGLRQISAERVWAETSKILSHHSGYWVYPLMIEMGVMDYTDLPAGNPDQMMWFKTMYARHTMSKMKFQQVVNLWPVVAVASFVDDVQHAEKLAKALKWSSQERDAVKHIKSYNDALVEWEIGYKVHVNGENPLYGFCAGVYYNGDWIAQDCAKRLQGLSAPNFEVTGGDLIALGVLKGPAVGAALKKLREYWYVTGMRADKDVLLAYFSESM